MYPENLNNQQIILASKSPRRQYLLKELGLDFKVIIKEIDETYPEYLTPEQVAVYLCEQKAKAFQDDELTDNTIIITADTIVCLENKILGKPVDYDDAVNILQQISGKEHEVITGVCLRAKNKTTSFYAKTKVHFKQLSLEEIHYYIEKYKPYDKAGAYGIQEWIGYIGIDKIEGSFYNVMGLPVQRLYEELLRF